VAGPRPARELLARIKGVLRRARDLPLDPLDELPGRLAFAGWVLAGYPQPRPHRPGRPGGGPEPRRYRLLHVLLTHPNRALSRDQLLDLTQGREAGPFDRSIDVLIGRLRRRLGDDAKEPALIKTLRGHGYLLAAKVTARP
jgi:two-component system OmpR family response regulator